MHADTDQSGDRLIIRHDLRVVQTVDLQVGPITIGRSSQCDIPLNHEGVSRNHARVERRDDGWYIVDADSVNGVLVNGRRAGEARITPGDVIEIRPFAMNYLSGEPDEPTAADRSIGLTDVGAMPTIVRERGPADRDIRQRLEDLYVLSRMVIQREDNGTFWQKVHAALQRSLAADRCVLVGVDESAGIYRLAPRSRSADLGAPLELSQSVLHEAIESSRGLLIQQVAQDDKFAEAQSLAVSGVGSVICAPVVVEGRTRAVVYADRHCASPPFEAGDLDFVMASADLAATVVGMDELHARARELSRVRGRIEAAREMQEMLLPTPIPQPSWGEVAAGNLPADQMSGDIYDVAIDAAGRLVVVLADVTGHGVPAAFVTAILQSALRQGIADLDDLGEIVQRVNGAMCSYGTTGCFATMLICRWSPSGERVEIANAGHHAPLWVDAAGKVEGYPERVGMLLGFAPTWDGQIVARDVTSDVAVLLSSDGAVEARNDDGAEYGLDGLATFLAASHENEAQAVIDRLVDDVISHCSPAEPTDDVTLLIVKRH